jgi:hypothetical protein
MNNTPPINRSSSSFWTILKQTLTEQGKGSSKRVIAYITTALVCFICINATIVKETIDHAIVLELLGFVAVLLGISAYQQGKGVTNPKLNTPTVNPDIPNTPKEPG